MQNLDTSLTWSITSPDSVTTIKSTRTDTGRVNLHDGSRNVLMARNSVSALRPTWKGGCSPHLPTALVLRIGLCTSSFSFSLQLLSQGLQGLWQLQQHKCSEHPSDRANVLSTTLASSTKQTLEQPPIKLSLHKQGLTRQKLRRAELLEGQAGFRVLPCYADQSIRCYLISRTWNLPGSLIAEPQS